MNSSFDTTASSFERFRLLPSGVPDRIRSTIRTAASITSISRVLDVGAGTGRIGRAFLEAGDFYVGVDTSLAMLREFQAGSNRGFLAQADGCQLPFPDGAFDIVLFMHVLSGARDSRALINEARRVLRPGGVLAVGHTVIPEPGIDEQLKHQLRLVLKEMDVDWHRPRESRREGLAWLESLAARHVYAQVASWKVSARARDFLLRHRSGARFASLPTAVQEQALQKLGAWAEKTFGSLDAKSDEQRSFVLDIFEF
jgi:ubiquinone/menaquinone biosynthesis C-methylase UbiE